MDNQEFLKKLENDLKPVQRLWSPHKRLFVWSTTSFLLILAIMINVQEFRSGFINQLLQPRFLVESLLGLSGFFTLSLVVLMKSVPGLSVPKKWIALSFIPFVLFVSLLFLGQWTSPSLAPSMAGKRPTCYHEILFLSWIPIGFLIYLVRKAFIKDSLIIRMAIGVSGACLPMAMMQVACMYIPEHILSHHVFPVLLVTVIMSLAGHWVLKKKTKPL